MPWLFTLWRGCHHVMLEADFDRRDREVPLPLPCGLLLAPPPPHARGGKRGAVVVVVRTLSRGARRHDQLGRKNGTTSVTAKSRGIRGNGASSARSIRSSDDRTDQARGAPQVTSGQRPPKPSRLRAKLVVSLRREERLRCAQEQGGIAEARREVDRGAELGEEARLAKEPIGVHAVYTGGGVALQRRSLASRCFALGALLSCGAAACELLLPTYEKAADGGASVGGDVCSPVGPPEHPPPPEGGIGTDVGSLRFIAAFETLPNLDAAAGTIGLDLDGLCTCVDASTGREACALRQKTTHCDSTGGRDIAGNDFFSVTLYGAFANTKSGDINARIKSGRLSFLIDVRGYNGTANQSKLVVGIYDSPGIYTLDGRADFVPPSWDGNDEWTVDCALSRASCPGDGGDLRWLGDAAITPGFIDEVAYVKDGNLVANLATLTLNLELTVVTMSNVWLVAKIVPEGSGYRLEGQIAGRSTTAEILRTVSRLKDSQGTPLCGSNPGLPGIRSVICAAADLPADPGDDGKDSPCSATSFALPFTARPAKIGYRYDKGATPPGCDGSVVDCDQN